MEEGYEEGEKEVCWIGLRMDVKGCESDCDCDCGCDCDSVTVDVTVNVTVNVTVEPCFLKKGRMCCFAKADYTNITHNTTT